MTKCLMVGAHCDDHEIFMFPWFQDRSIQRIALVCSDDSKNPARASYARGPEAFHASCELAGITVRRTLPFGSEFYRLRTRGAGEGPILMDWWNIASEAVREMSEGCDFVVCHGPADYCHMDHILVRRMVYATTRLPIRWADGFHQTTTWPVGDRTRLVNCGTKIGTAELDVELYERCKAEYDKRGAWTWSWPCPTPVGLYEERYDG
jgi:LmbE family N-acetylglucosaminyl deacetylase